MTTTTPMLDAHPGTTDLDREALGEVIDTLLTCAEACTACADACLGEPDVAELTHCIRLNLDCADVCCVTARVLSRQTHYDPRLSLNLLQVCLVACQTCGDECAHHAPHHGHCQLCAEACRDCEDACRELVAMML